MKELGIPVNSELTDEEKETINDYLRNQEEMVPSDGQWYSKEALSQYGNSYSYRTYQDAIEDIAMESAFIDQSAYREEKDFCSVYDGFGQVHINDVFYYENGFFVFNQHRMKETENYYFYTEHSNAQGEKMTLENERIYQSQTGIDFTVADLVGSNTMKSEVLVVATMDQNFLEIVFMNLTEEEIHNVLDNLRMDY